MEEIVAGLIFQNQSLQASVNIHVHCSVSFVRAAIRKKHPSPARAAVRAQLGSSPHGPSGVVSGLPVPPHPRAVHGGERASALPLRGCGGGSHLHGSALCPELKGQASATQDPDME